MDTKDRLQMINVLCAIQSAGKEITAHSGHSKALGFTHARSTYISHSAFLAICSLAGNDQYSDVRIRLADLRNRITDTHAVYRDDQSRMSKRSVTLLTQDESLPRIDQFLRELDLHLGDLPF